MSYSYQNINNQVTVESALKEEFLKSLRACIYAATSNEIKQDLIEILKKASRS